MRESDPNLAETYYKAVRPDGCLSALMRESDPNEKNFPYSHGTGFLVCLSALMRESDPNDWLMGFWEQLTDHMANHTDPTHLTEYAQRAANQSGGNK